MFGWLKLARRVSDLEEVCAHLDREVKQKDMDWADLRARCKRLLDRDEKAIRQLNKESGVDSAEAAPTNGEAPANATHGRLLTPHQIEIQQKILRRRAGL